MANHINDLFNAITPNEEQKAKMLVAILNQSSNTKNKISPFHTPPKQGIWLRPILAGVICLLLGIGGFLFMGVGNTFAVYAYETNEEITDTGVELSTGTLKQGGEMTGQLMQLYVKGKNIDAIRYSCKNQYMDFTDWTEARQNFSMKKQFTVSYGKETSDYEYLVVNWNPNDTIRKLTDNPNLAIANLKEELKNEIIVLEVTFSDGSKATKAVHITLENKGKIAAKIQDYVVTEKDGFILNPPKEPLPQANPNKGKDPQPRSQTYSEAEIKEAKAVAEKYYSGFTGDRKIVSMEYTEKSPSQNSFIPDQYKGWQIIVFKAYEKSMYPEVARSIFLARNSSKDKWIVINEGY